MISFPRLTGEVSMAPLMCSPVSHVGHGHHVPAVFTGTGSSPLLYVLQHNLNPLLYIKQVRQTCSFMMVDSRWMSPELMAFCLDSTALWLSLCSPCMDWIMSFWLLTPSSRAVFLASSSAILALAAVSCWLLCRSLIYQLLPHGELPAGSVWSPLSCQALLLPHY